MVANQALNSSPAFAAQSSNEPSSETAHDWVEHNNDNIINSQPPNSASSSTCIQLIFMPDDHFILVIEFV